MQVTPCNYLPHRNSNVSFCMTSTSKWLNLSIEKTLSKKIDRKIQFSSFWALCHETFFTNSIPYNTLYILVCKVCMRYSISSVTNQFSSLFVSSFWLYLSWKSPPPISNNKNIPSFYPMNVSFKWWNYNL